MGRWAVIATVLLLLGAAWGMRHWTRPQPVTVAVARVDRGEVRKVAANTRAGTVKACRRAGISPAIGGRVAILSVREGDRVAAGQPLLELWNEDLKAQKLLAEREAESVQARATEACLMAEIARKEAGRAERLVAKGVASEERHDRSGTEALAKEAACRAARAEEQVAQSRVRVVEVDLERTGMRAPFDGVVAALNAEVGEYVTPSPPGIPTPPAVDLIEESCLLVSAPVDEVDAPAIRPGMPVCVTLDAFSGERCRARVLRVAPYVLEREKQARTLEVEVTLDDPKEREGLLPGYSADIEVVLDRRQGVVRTPTEAVWEGNRVWVLEEDGILKARTLKMGLGDWRFTEILAGIREGERVVVSVAREGVKEGARAVAEDEPAGKGAAP